jgi:hypothetical protein
MMAPRDSRSTSLSHTRRCQAQCRARRGSRKAKAPSARHFIEHKHRTGGMAGIDHVLQETITRELAAHRLHHHGGDFAIELLQRGTEGFRIVVAKRHRRARQLSRHTERLQTGQKMTIQRGIIAEVRGEIPIAPTMIAAEGDAAFASRRSRDAHREPEGLAAAASIAHLPGPRMQIEQYIGEFHLIRRRQRGIAAEIHATLHRRVHLIIRMAEQNGSDAAGEVRVAPAIEIPDARALRPRKIRGPRLRIERDAPVSTTSPCRRKSSSWLLPKVWSQL